MGVVGIGGSTKVDWQGGDGWAARGFFATKDRKATADKLFISYLHSRELDLERVMSINVRGCDG